MLGDLYLIHAQLTIETREFSGSSFTDNTYVEELKSPGQLNRNKKGTGYFGRILQLVTEQRNRRAVVGCFVVMAAQYAPPGHTNTLPIKLHGRCV
jgi:hypothetical protein